MKVEHHRAPQNTEHQQGVLTCPGVAASGVPIKRSLGGFEGEKGVAICLHMAINLPEGLVATGVGRLQPLSNSLHLALPCHFLGIPWTEPSGTHPR